MRIVSIRSVTLMAAATVDGCAPSRLLSRRSLRYSDVGFGGFFLFFLWRRCRRTGLRMPWTAVFVQEIVDPGARSLQRSIRRRYVDLQKFDFIRRLCAFVNLDP